MGINDRPYARDEAAPSPRGRVGSVRMFSVNTWIIIINVAVLALQAIWPQFLLWSKVWGPFSTFDIFGVSPKGYLNLEIWRLITFQFLHSGLTHLFFNMFGLWVFGGMVEQYLGSKKYAAFYLMCGICGGLTYLLLNLLGNLTHSAGFTIPGVLIDDPRTQLVGASAGVFGVIMACAYIAPNTVVQLLFPPVPLRLKTMAYVYVAIAAFNLLFGGRNAGGDAAHIGGAIAGFFFIRRSHLLRDFFDVFSDSRRMERKPAAPRGVTTVGDAEIDRILDKVKAEGLASLTDRERRTLADATRAQRESA